ncbi:E3 ubiquitin-protein ligase DTX1 [Gopherus flavomarginatus]|uniref:E3 ubiquitin-protein ligase DTX1 n=1 Tax=Gopherus flavomarginatus TaxID=286002 RepID=UPI0021CC30C9|nr:E3 ubiquitin-protein ligase DTX1 [Gopherus flavomarginatus]
MLRPSSGVLISVNGLGFPPQNLARVVVWEWLNEHGRWRPYTAAVCHHIENVLKEDARGSVVLGQVDPQLAPYIIDLQSMHQFRQDTGTMRPVRRNFYDPSSAPGKGIVWEWENDNNSWTPYDMDICITIQNAYEKQHPWLDLSSLGFCYLIYFNSMSQMNRQTQRKRRLRRRMDLAYPLTMGSIPKSQSWPVGTNSGQPCSCQQCLLVNSTRAASNAILASQRRKVYVGNSNGTLTVRQSSTFNGTALWSAGTMPTGGTAKMEQVRSPSGMQVTTFSRSQSAPTGTQLPGQNNLNRPGTQQVAILSTRASIPPGCLTALAGKASACWLCHIRIPPTAVVDSGGGHHLGMSSNLQRCEVSPEDWDCTICMERLVASSGYEGLLSHRGAKPELVGKLGKCGHMYHLLCLVAMYNNGNKDGSLQCPTCKAIYGEKTGTQPPGKMEFHIIPHSLPGYTESKTIRIVYDIPTGIQGPEHPNPGKKFTARGFPRHCYLPDNEKGRKVLKLLIVAWDRRLIFTIGTSSTTGECDTVVWNEIHHKTEFGSNLTGHGYPDPNYLDNVLAELMAQGVLEANLKG